MENKLFVALLFAFVVWFTPGLASTLEAAYNLSAPAWVVVPALVFGIEWTGEKIYTMYKASKKYG